MKRIVNREQLKPGTIITKVSRDIFTDYRVLMIHPYNDDYILLLNCWTQRPEREYIPSILDKEWYEDVSKEDRFLLEKEYHEECLRRLKIDKEYESIDK